MKAVLDKRVKNAEIRVLSMLGCYIDSNGYCYPAVTKLSEKLGVDRRNLQRCLRNLERLGYITIMHTKRPGGGWGRNSYQVHFPKHVATYQKLLVPGAAASSDPEQPSEPQASNTSAHASLCARNDASSSPHNREQLTKAIKGEQPFLDCTAAQGRIGKAKIALSRRAKHKPRKDYMTAIVDNLVEKYGVDRAAAWHALMGLPKALQTGIELGTHDLDEVYQHLGLL